jgi:hypothetical protein
MWIALPKGDWWVRRKDHEAWVCLGVTMTGHPGTQVAAIVRDGKIDSVILDSPYADGSVYRLEH